MAKKEDKLAEVYKEILDRCGDSVFCKFEVCQDGRKAIRVCGKVHMLDISIDEFMRRIESELSRYGERSRKALDGSDWKALSHAIRGIFQINELIETNYLIFPLTEANTLKMIKNGELSMDIVNTMISHGLDSVKEKLDLMETKKVDVQYTDNFILGCYTKL